MRNCRGWIIGALLVLTLSGCGAADTDAVQQAAAREFLTERNGGTPVALGDADNSPAIGTIERIDGRTLTLKRPIDNGTETIELADDARISQQSTTGREALTVGQQAVVLGTRSGETIEAQAIQLGTSARGGPLIRLAPGAAPAGTQPQTQPLRIEPGASDQPAAPGDTVIGGTGTDQVAPLAGTIEQIDGDTLTLKLADGTQATVRLSATTEISEQREVALDTLQPGQFVLATGARSDGKLHASEIELLPPPPR